MKFSELLKFLQDNEIDFNYIIDELGYKTQSIKNNWTQREKNNKDIPITFEKALQLYLDLEKEKAKNTHNVNQITTENNLISEKAIEIAKYKCSESNISLKEYLSSLVIATL